MVLGFFLFFPTCSISGLCSLDGAFKLSAGLHARFCPEDILGYIPVHDWKEKGDKVVCFLK